MRNTCSEINRKICLKIKLERIKRSWSQEELAEHASLSVNTIGRIERSRIPPSIDTVVQIASALGIDFSKLTDITNL